MNHENFESEEPFSKKSAMTPLYFCLRIIIHHNEAINNSELLGTPRHPGGMKQFRDEQTEGSVCYITPILFQEKTKNTYIFEKKELWFLRVTSTRRGDNAKKKKSTPTCSQ